MGNVKRISLWLFGVFFTLIISFYFTKEDAETLWDWFIIQINPIVIILFILVILLLTKNKLLKLFKSNTYSVGSTLNESGSNIGLSQEEKTVTIIAEEIKNDNKLKLIFEDIRININSNEYDYFEDNSENIKYFLSKGLIQNYIYGNF